MTEKKYQNDGKSAEKGAALVTVLILLAILGVIAAGVLTFASSEARIAGSDLRRMQTFYASKTGIEDLTFQFNELFRRKINPNAADLQRISDNYPVELDNEGFTLTRSINIDEERLKTLRRMQGVSLTTTPRATISTGPYAGLFANVLPYQMHTDAVHNSTGTRVRLTREVDNFMIPLFQFGLFSSNDDLELSPRPMLTFNGRIHTNSNLYVNHNVRFFDRVTVAGELVRDTFRSGNANIEIDRNDVFANVSDFDVRITKGSVQSNGSNLVGGPNFPGVTDPLQRGYNPGSPDGEPNPTWETDSTTPADGTDNFAGGLIQTRTTNARKLRLPLELADNSPVHLIKRSMPDDSTILAGSRYQNKAQIQILIDDEDSGAGAVNVAGIPATEGVNLSTFQPLPLDNGKALRRVNDTGNYIEDDSTAVKDSNGNLALTVRGTAANYTDPSIAAGSGLKGKIVIRLIDADGTAHDVTRTVLSLGVTVGEPNAIVHLQRPLWASYMQGSFDRTGSGWTLSNLLTSTNIAADGELKFSDMDPAAPVTTISDTYTAGLALGYINNVVDDDNGVPVRSSITNTSLNAIVPMNVYNVREGWARTEAMNEFQVYERGITQIVELNMHNLVRWLDGVYDNHLLAGTNALSTNIDGSAGYIVYVSDRRGDKVKAELNASGATIMTTNGTVDNEDIYGADGVLQPGEDVIDYGFDVALNAPKQGTLQKDTTELPDIGNTWSNGDGSFAARRQRADTIAAWSNPSRYFRNAVRLFNGATLTTDGANGHLSEVKGLTIAAENMVYIWGSYNTMGIRFLPTDASTHNDDFIGSSVPASIVCDAIFPLSNTWFDASASLYPEGTKLGLDRVNNDPWSSLNNEAYRIADAGLSLNNPSDWRQETAVRAAILAGTTMSAIDGDPGRHSVGFAGATGSARLWGNRTNGGIHNYPRFLEIWTFEPSLEKVWSYTGSLVPLFHSTQAVGQWAAISPTIYGAPRRNWSFDTTFREPGKLPPGTPFFQYVQPTGFREEIEN